MLPPSHKHLWASKTGWVVVWDIVELDAPLQSAVAFWDGGLTVGETPLLIPWKVAGLKTCQVLMLRCHFWS